MATLTTNAVSNLGLRFDNLLVAAAGGGDQCATGPGIALVVRNTGVSTTVTLATPGVVDGDLAVANRDVVVAATTGLSIIPIPHLYRDSTTGRCAITYSQVTGITVCCIAMSTS